LNDSSQEFSNWLFYTRIVGLQVFFLTLNALNNAFETVFLGVRRLFGSYLGPRRHAFVGMEGVPCSLVASRLRLLHHLLCEFLDFISFSKQRR
jgi:hypothetical protein